MTQDQEIRLAGFRIDERPARGPAIWRRGGRLYADGTALMMSRREAPKREMLAEAAKLEAQKRGR